MKIPNVAVYEVERAHGDPTNQRIIQTTTIPTPIARTMTMEAQDRVVDVHEASTKGDNGDGIHGEVSGSDTSHEKDTDAREKNQQHANLH
ncbi:hypothetical protein DVH05_015496 [Phytophthora capsici]|nr:hypothetical protein DVH05_020719 [Phytophthora capsici]KAG1698012.1 hypothetical protein DVH05_015496 [Phytophthora capsici]